VVRGTWQRKKLKFANLKNPLFVSSFHGLNLGSKAKRNAKALGVGDYEKYSKILEILASYSVTWEQLEFTRFHTIPLELFFTGINKACRPRPVTSLGVVPCKETSMWSRTTNVQREGSQAKEILSRRLTSDLGIMMLVLSHSLLAQ
jgi:hypothetical protein